MRKILLTTLISAMCLTSAFARPGMGEGKGKGKFKQMIQELNLTEEQITKIKEHRKENKGDMKGGREEMKKLREEFQAAFVNGASDSELTSLNGKLKSLKDQKAEARLKKMIFFKNILTKEQRESFLNSRKKFKGHKED